jgi:3-methylcrotonyl-CoA carboxylase alpha subunit
MSLKLTLDGRVHEVSIVRRRPHLVLRIDGQDHELTELPAAGQGRMSLTMGGHALPFARATVGDRQFVRAAGRTFDIGFVDPFSRASAGSGLDVVRAPMPGAVISVHRQAGDRVARGEALVTIESMKLQTALPSPRDGILAAVHRSEGETFEKDAIIATLEPQVDEG